MGEHATSTLPAPTLPKPASHETDVRSMFDRIAGRYDAANRVMSAGIDVLWRRKAMKPLLTGLGDAPRVLDLGAGTLDGALEIHRRKPHATIVGADFARKMLSVGRTKLGPAASHIATHAADGQRLPYAEGVFDAAFTAFCIRNLTDLPRGLAELRRVVKPGGPLVILEFLRPAKTRFFFDKLYNARVLPLVGWAVTGDRAAYSYLPDSIKRFASRPELEDALRAVGFATVTAQELFPAGVASLVVAR